MCTYILLCHKEKDILCSYFHGICFCSRYCGICEETSRKKDPKRKTIAHGLWERTVEIQRILRYAGTRNRANERPASQTRNRPAWVPISAPRGQQKGYHSRHQSCGWEWEGSALSTRDPAHWGTLRHTWYKLAPIWEWSLVIVKVIYFCEHIVYRFVWHFFFVGKPCIYTSPLPHP